MISHPTRYCELVGSLIYPIVTHIDIPLAVHVLNQFIRATTFVHYELYFECLVISTTTCHDLALHLQFLPLSLSLFWCWIGRWSWHSALHHMLLYISRFFSYLLAHQMPGCCLSLEHRSRVLHYGWYYLRALMVTQSSSWYVCFCAYSNSHVLWWQECLCHCFQSCFKHMKVDCHITYRAYEKRTISLPYVLSVSQLADFFTKAQTSLWFHTLLSKLSVFDLSWVWANIKILIY